MIHTMKTLTTREFSMATGIPVATISKLIRAGKIKAKKQGKAWMIAPGQLECGAVRAIRVSAHALETPLPERDTASKMIEAHESAMAEPESIGAAAASPATSAPGNDPTVTEDGPGPAEKTYSIAEFAAMTYLTDCGVSQWLRSGRLLGCRSEDGEWRVLESNFSVPDISRLVRK